jgi:membrane associated rhomboid family serine protease
LEHGELTTVEEGVKIHNLGVQCYNDGVQLLNSAAQIFDHARQKPKNHSGTSMTATSPGTQSVNTKPTWSIPGLGMPTLPFGGAQDSFPIVAVIILIGTTITSLQAFADPQLFEKYILHPWSIVNHKARYYTLLSSGLIHADPMHLMMNLMSFCFFGLVLETIIGHARFLLVYAGSLLFSSLVLTVKNANNAYYRALGASGAITGVIFSYILYHPNSKISFMFAPMGVPAPVFALAYVGYSYYMAKTKMDNVAHDAHLWGAIAGALITVVVDPNLMGIMARFYH